MRSDRRARNLQLIAGFGSCKSLSESYYRPGTPPMQPKAAKVLESVSKDSEVIY